MREQVGPNWRVVKARTTRSRFYRPGDTLLLQREYDALAARYEAQFGPRYAA